MARRLIVGLGNVGREYDFTRHNVGFFILDALACDNGLVWSLDKKHEAFVAKWQYKNDIIFLAKPTTFMNLSGRAVASLCKYYKILNEDIIVVYDDIAFHVGDVRVCLRDGCGGHNGVADVLSKVGGGFTRFRIGIGSKPTKQMDLKDYVLSKFSQDEIKILEGRMPEILEYLKLLLDKNSKDDINPTNRDKSYGGN